MGVKLATVDGKPISGQKGTMLEGGSRVPLIVNWSGTTPAGQVKKDLIDFSDFFPTFAELGGAELPKGVTIDGHSFAPQILGKKGTPRDWIYVELNGKSYVRNAGFKLTNHGELFDMSDAPFKEIPVAASTTNAAAASARAVLQKVLDDHQTAPAAPKDGKKKQKKAAKKKAARKSSDL
jgi:arylsulfatase A